jgi:hypothetical protein
MPVVIFTGDFLQFGPIQQKGFLSDMEQIAEEYVKNRPKGQKHWRWWPSGSGRNLTMSLSLESREGRQKPLFGRV